MISTREVTAAFIAMLATGTGKPVGEGTKPEGDHTEYYIVHTITRQTSGAPMTDLSEDCTIVYQVDHISAADLTLPGSHGTQDQMEWLADTARAVILARHPITRTWLHPLTVPGARVIGRAADTEVGGTADATDGIMSSASRFAITLNSD
ncbi:hypothetical protein [Streptomyces sp. NPDC101249]|uniref:hypothetical protein n=1 Tax=Streptomyces sp. NPDC101249 TaxID=3366140 RepID=UPI0037F24513